MATQRRVTLKDVARSAKMSISGVSMALRNDPSIPESTCKRIQVLAQRMGYRSNPYISALMKNRGSRKKKTDPYIAPIAYVNHSEPFILNQNRATLNSKEASDKSNVRDFYQGAEQRAREKGYHLELVHHDPKRMTYSMMNRIFKTRNIRGFILSPLDLHSEQPDFDWQYFACSTIGYSVRSKINRAIPEYVNMIEVIIKHVLEKGYRRIGLVQTGYHLNRYGKYWAQGYAYYSFQQTVKDRIPIYVAELGTEANVRVWIKNYAPEIIISSSNAIYPVLESNGISIPLVDLTHRHRPPVGAYFDQHSNVLGEMAVDLVISQLISNEYGIPEEEKTIMVKGSFENTKCIPNLKIKGSQAKAVFGKPLFIRDDDMGL